MILYEGFCKAYGFISEDKFEEIDSNIVLNFSMINSHRYKVGDKNG